MRDLEKSVGMHRRTSGVFKSNPGDDFGTFDFLWAHNRNVAERKVVCTVLKGEGWECLNILVYDNKAKKQLWPRAPYHTEIIRLIPLFFWPSEHPVQFYNFNDSRGRGGLNFWLSERVQDAASHLPVIGNHFKLEKLPT